MNRKFMAFANEFQVAELPGSEKRGEIQQTYVSFGLHVDENTTLCYFQGNGKSKSDIDELSSLLLVS